MEGHPGRGGPGPRAPTYKPFTIDIRKVGISTVAPIKRNNQKLAQNWTFVFNQMLRKLNLYEMATLGRSSSPHLPVDHPRSAEADAALAGIITEAIKDDATILTDIRSSFVDAPSDGYREQGRSRGFQVLSPQGQW